MAETPLRVLIVEDEPVARATLRKLLEQDAEVEVVGECANGHEAVRAVREKRPDLMFLDVQMPGLTGMGVLEALSSDERPRVIFTTAYDHYAVKAFEEQAIDYLLKPFDDDRFASALQRAKQVTRQDALAGIGRKVTELVSDVGGAATKGAATPPAQSLPSRLSVHREGKIELVDVSEIDWIEAADQYVRLHAAQGENLMRESMGELEKLLDPNLFMRVHRSAIVAFDRIVRLESKSGGNGRILLRDGTWVPVSRSRIPALRKRLG